MNLTSLLEQEYLGVRPGGVVDVDVELNWQSVVTLVISNYLRYRILINNGS